MIPENCFRDFDLDLNSGPCLQIESPGKALYWRSLVCYPFYIVRKVKHLKFNSQVCICSMGGLAGALEWLIVVCSTSLK